MREAKTWVLVIVLVLLVIGLVAYARGAEHHRGDDVGTISIVGETGV